MKQLTITDLHYFSAGDQQSFFGWLGRIKCAGPTKRVGRKLLISIHDSEVADEDLRELIALLQRYNVDKRQLAQFVSEKNAAWFRDDPATYWHEDVFKSASS